MRNIILFWLLYFVTWSTVEAQTIKNDEIIITGKEPEFKIKVPAWVRALDREMEIKNYTYNSNGPKSIAGIRDTYEGSCVAFAKLGALYALTEGWNCKFVGITDGSRTGHLFLYASHNDTHWLVSNNSRHYVYSIKDAMVRIGALNYRIISETNVTLENLETKDWSTAHHTP